MPAENSRSRRAPSRLMTPGRLLKLDQFTTAVHSTNPLGGRKVPSSCAYALRRSRTCPMIKYGIRSWVGLGMLLLAAPLHAQANRDFTTPIDPFRIAGNL